MFFSLQACLLEVLLNRMPRMSTAFSTLSPISSITTGLTTTPRYTGVKACLCHLQIIRHHPPSILHTEQCHCNVIQRPAAVSFVPTLDMDLNPWMKPSGPVHPSPKRWQYVQLHIDLTYLPSFAFYHFKNCLYMFRLHINSINILIEV